MSVGVETNFVLAVCLGFGMVGALRLALHIFHGGDRLPLARLPGWFL